ncbi:MAG: hypothetical protein V3W44_08530 [Dehalococcoidales bacterium]
MSIRSQILQFIRREDKAGEAENAEERFRQLEEFRRLDYRKVFAGPVGQRVLADLARRSFVLESTWAQHKEGQIDPFLMAFHEGRRAMVVELLEYLDEPIIEEILYDEVDHG